MTNPQGRYGLHGVAFIRQTGGRVHVLFAIDELGEDRHDGEPVLLVDHRPGDAPTSLVVEAADEIPAQGVDHVREQATQLASWIDSAFDAAGTFDGERILGEAHRFDAPPGVFNISASE